MLMARPLLWRRRVSDGAKRIQTRWDKLARNFLKTDPVQSTERATSTVLAQQAIR